MNDILKSWLTPRGLITSLIIIAAIVIYLELTKNKRQAKKLLAIMQRDGYKTALPKYLLSPATASKIAADVLQKPTDTNVELSAYLKNIAPIAPLVSLAGNLVEDKVDTNKLKGALESIPNFYALQQVNAAFQTTYNASMAAFLAANCSHKTLAEIYRAINKKHVAVAGDIDSTSTKRSKNILFSPMANKAQMASFLLGIEKVADLFGKETAKKVEQIFRLETRNFESQQFAATNTPGMQYNGGAWDKILDYFRNKYGYAVTGKIPFRDNQTGQIIDFLKFDSAEGAAVFLGDYINRHGGDFAVWNTTDPVRKAKYQNAVNSMSNPITNKLFNI